MKRENVSIITKSPLTIEIKSQANINKTANNEFLIYTFFLKLGHVFKVLSDFGG
jgi:hypothetical protein